MLSCLLTYWCLVFQLNFTFLDMFPSVSEPASVSLLRLKYTIGLRSERIHTMHVLIVS